MSNTETTASESASGSGSKRLDRFKAQSLIQAHSKRMKNSHLCPTINPLINHLANQCQNYSWKNHV